MLQLLTDALASLIIKKKIETMGVKMIAFCCRRAAKCSYSNKAEISDEFRIDTNHAQNDGYAFHKEREREKKNKS